ncbi:hypothetical protein BB559_005139 [Furculomyces boomerangus]|uniref:Uncharacterized protein n=1 Tax=Furculomyces boomerangus TaxID=61424 RepID=A0A2T9YAI2_9FUNG|nr:hypothetical protein BB559_005139 [Furculomyces boomerangus]
MMSKSEKKNIVKTMEVENSSGRSKGEPGLGPTGYSKLALSNLEASNLPRLI